MLSGSEAVMTALAAALAVRLMGQKADRGAALDLAGYNESLAALESGLSRPARGPDRRPARPHGGVP
jgi:hypothetical protein